MFRAEQNTAESHQPKNLVILGAGGFAREVAWLVTEINKVQPIWNLIGFWEQGVERIGSSINSVPIIDVDEVKRQMPGIYTVVAIGNPMIKERAVRQAEREGCLFTTLIHPSVRFDPDTVTMGPGTIVCAGSILTVNIQVGAHVIVNLDCTIGHDSIIEDYATLSPGCHLSGHTKIRRGAFLGTGCVTIENCEIGTHSNIGAGAVVVRDIPANCTAMGVPARAKL